MNAGVSTPRRCCPVIELRQYTLKPGQRDVLIDLFDRHFVESQEAAGMTIVGQFRDRRRPDRFVWIRGFPDMASRHQALERFYGGPVWAAHRTAANATMLDVSDVLLLRPVRSDGGFLLEGDQMTPGAPPRNPTTVLAASLCAGEAGGRCRSCRNSRSRLRHACTPMGSRSKAYS